MEIKRGNTVVCDVYLKDNSYTVEEIMGEDTLTLNFLSRNVVNLQINDYIDFEGTKYKIRHNEKVTKRETSLGWEYTVQFYSSRYDLLDAEFFLHGTPERKKNFDYYTGTARDWLILFVKNMNRTGSGWVAGSCIESRMITLSFKDKKVGTVLDELIKELDTEYWISGQTINIGRREYSSNGLVLAQGEGMGFTELEVSAVDDTPPVTVFYPYGSDRNLGPDYGADFLLLPDGRLSIEKNVEKYGRIEKSMQFDHIFPKGEFAVTEKIDDYTLRAFGMDFNLTDCLLDGVEVIVTFQDGGLAGYDLAIVEDSWDNNLKQFKLKQNDQENALKVPGDINFSVGDKFILTGLKMPQSYRDNASLQLQEEAQTWLDGKCEKRIQLRGKCDEIVFRQQNIIVSSGQMVGIYSEQLDIDREIRVTRVKRYIEKDGTPSYRYELTLSDFLESNGFKDLVDDVNKVPEEIKDSVHPLKEYTKRRFRDAQETQTMLEKVFDNFSKGINPVWVQTMSLLVGDESLQFRFVTNKTNPAATEPDFVYNQEESVLSISSAILQHMTLGIKDIKGAHDVSEYKFWDIPSFLSPKLRGHGAMYLYAKCNKSRTTGNFWLSEDAFKMDPGDGNYYFLIGTLGSELDGIRSFTTVYGFTEVLPGRITVDRIISPDGSSFWDMLSGAFRIGNDMANLGFNLDGQGRLVLKGTMVQSPSGETSVIGVYRGDYNSSTTYYEGDEVSYNGSTYRFKKDQGRGIIPTNTTYWGIVAKAGTNGEDGRDGQDGDKGDKGDKGDDGIDGPVVTFRGEYSSSKSYYGDRYRVDCVKHGSTYYLARTDNGGTFSGKTPTNASWWRPVGGSFESIATGFLLAETATINGVSFNDGQIIGSTNTSFKIDTKYGLSNFYDPRNDCFIGIRPGGKNISIGLKQIAMVDIEVSGMDYNNQEGRIILRKRSGGKDIGSISINMDGIYKNGTRIIDF